MQSKTGARRELTRIVKRDGEGVARMVNERWGWMVGDEKQLERPLSAMGDALSRCVQP